MKAEKPDQETADIVRELKAKQVSGPTFVVGGGTLYCVGRSFPSRAEAVSQLSKLPGTLYIWRAGRIKAHLAEYTKSPYFVWFATPDAA